MPRAGLDTAAVVAAAGALADAHGLDSLTVARLAAELNVRPPSLYAHVGGLEDLRRRIGRQGAAQLTTRLQAAAAGRARRQALRAVADEYRAFANQHPGLYAAIQRPWAPSDADDPGEPGDTGELVDVILAVLRGYELAGDDALHAVRIVRSAMHGFVLLESEHGFQIPLDLDDTYMRMIAVLDEGLSSGAGALT